MNAEARGSVSWVAPDLWVGIDVGSVTVKVAVCDPHSHELLHADYARHNAEQAQTARRLLEQAHARFADRRFAVAVCGSGGEGIAEAIDAFFIQEVVANSIAVRRFYPQSRVAIELGGQDAKVVFFTHDEATDKLVASDMRMNGSCAGGTGAFVDQMAELLDVKTENFNALASQGRQVYDISGRCGVFAKTDIQPLLNQCVAKEDIALSVFHALAKQTIGGLVQGMRITPPVIFEGGPLTFNPRLIQVFAERLDLSPDHVIIPDRPEILVAHGAALSVGAMFGEQPSRYDPVLMSALDGSARGDKAHIDFESLPFFDSDDERRAFARRHPLPDFSPRYAEPGTRLPVYLGIDAGSTTSKGVILDEQGELVDKFYQGNQGDPLRVVQQALIDMRERHAAMGVELDVRAVGTTGYGEKLFARAFKADVHTVETVAHAEAARSLDPRVGFILDIGGQDMKTIRLGDGIVTGITLNEACSAGCGSFIETFARSMGIAVDDIAGLAFTSQRPSRLGSRCTVFMNSSVITEQKNGKTPADIMAGISRSIIENVFTKVVRLPNFDQLGEVIFAQGGTFKNDAVLRSMEQYCGRQVIRPPHPGEMGAIGIALLARARVEQQRGQGDDFRSSFIGLDAMDDFGYSKLPADVCPFCSNNCSRSRVRFVDGSTFVTGNRCERGEVFGDPRDKAIQAQVKEAHQLMKQVPDLNLLRNRLLFKDYRPERLLAARDVTLGLPRALEFYNSMPFWSTLLRALGFTVKISHKSDVALFERGLQGVPSDTICFPAKLVHGHVLDLIDQGVDRIFMPMMIKIPAENASTQGVHTCAVIQGYPLIVDESDEPQRRHGVAFDRPAFHWYTRSLRDRQIVDTLSRLYDLPRGAIKKAIRLGDRAMTSMQQELLRAGQKILDDLGDDDFAVVLAARPYHGDELVNHDLATHFTRQGIPVLTLDALPGLHQQDLRRVRAETVNPFHVRMFSAAMQVARDPRLEIAQIVSFGCGHDAVITDEMQRLLSALSDKQLLVLKLDEGEARGPLNIRVTSFIETVGARRQRDRGTPVVRRELPEPFEVLFEKKDRAHRTILAPNISRGFAEVISAVGERLGYRVEPLPIADARAIELGKKYLHNDICYPAQINVGEFLSLMERGTHKPDEVVLGLAKNCDDCRAGQYATLARKALDDAGFSSVPIMTTGTDTKGMHPGFTMGPREQSNVLWGIGFMDAMDDMRRKCRPYEMQPGQIDDLYREHWDNVLRGLATGGNKQALEALAQAVDAFNAVPLDRQRRKPRVGVIGEILLNYHPSANGDVIGYLERNGMEVILPSMVDFFRRDGIRIQDGIPRHHIPHPWMQGLMVGVTEKIFTYMLGKVQPIHSRFRYYEPHPDCHQLKHNVSDFIDTTYMVGEGWLIPAEILELAKHGVKAFVIVQPFGCLPNHITGRGLIKTLKRRHPGIQIVSLDYDPDTSFANVENRLQMLIMSARELSSIETADSESPALALPVVVPDLDEDSVAG